MRQVFSVQFSDLVRCSMFHVAELRKGVFAKLSRLIQVLALENGIDEVWDEA